MVINSNNLKYPISDNDMKEEQEKVFWELLSIFHEQGLLPYVMLIGSWSEYIYQNYCYSNFKSSFITRDVDFFYMNIKRPTGKKIKIFEALSDNGYNYEENRISGVGKFSKGDFLEVEFLIRVLGDGHNAHQKIPSLGIVGIGLREMNILEKYPLVVQCEEYTITVPEPEVYILQKLLINPTRGEYKKEKDMISIKELLPYVNTERLQTIYNNFYKKQQRVIDEVCEKNLIEF